MKNIYDDYGWIPRPYQPLHPAVQLGWVSPEFPENENRFYCYRCNRPISTSTSGALYECERCMNLSNE
ncbi:hypothetical protein ACOJUR_13060 [Alicyclobacillus tolerans]|uniref:Uncharacterized protein n=2 Tax=Alicyclobacillus tolerans TaxID=90970 RepID=A0A1M6SPT4_9BACL|nr:MULTISPECIES: hypothetical protein [Alicyclobacillus]MDP9727156.1 hypothetical protein [Alicyclobacillus tengchongensis]QRF22924.1 hypothetical protein FY534_03945 [Alicyclobacillus sp. TC]SHK46659.1 hypothetical protein SAMN05443507_11449 [Alicyclobacillus montanus]